MHYNAMILRGVNETEAEGEAERGSSRILFT